MSLTKFWLYHCIFTVYITFFLLLILLTVTADRKPIFYPETGLTHDRKYIYTDEEDYLDTSEESLENINNHRNLDLHHQRTNLKKANIIVIMTDDQDIFLGSMEVMNKTRKILGDRGSTFTNAFVTTPMCCPSRSTFLTGLYVHNHGVLTNNEHCGSRAWQTGPETRNFGVYLQSAGYNTGYFGKYLNSYDGEHIPPGWNEWVALLHNSRYYNYKLNRNGKIFKHGSNYYSDYFPDLITNDSISFFKISKQINPNVPVAMVLSFPSPHGPEDAAPSYQHMFQDTMTHRTETWNFAPNPDKHWIFQYTGEMTPIQMKFTDVLQQKRLQTLLSVDDAVQKIYDMLVEEGEIDNTFILYTSDHGYHLGQFGLIKGKSMPYDFDVRVPFFISGPDILPGTIVPEIVLNIDLAPTILDMAGVTAPEEIDGQSVLKLIPGLGNSRRQSRARKVWRDVFLIERGKPKEFSNSLPKDERIQQECGKLEYQSPCKEGQIKECVRTDSGKMQIRKCRSMDKKNKCECNDSQSKQTSRKERKSQRRFLKKHVAHDEFKPRFIRDISKRRNIKMPPKCQVYPNDTIICEKEILSSRQKFTDHKNFIERKLDKLKKQIKDFRDVKEYLKNFELDLSGDKCICEDNSKRKKPKNKKNRKNNGSTVENIDFDLFSRFEDFTEEELDQQIRRKEQKERRIYQEKLQFGEGGDPCNLPGLSCFRHSNSHWETPPLWNLGPFCFCGNAVNNTYWCLRTINNRENFLYCEYITGFLEYFDMRTDFDPFQKMNIIHEISMEKRRILHDKLVELRKCSGSKLCNTKLIS